MKEIICDYCGKKELVDDLTYSEMIESFECDICNDCIENEAY